MEQLLTVDEVAARLQTTTKTVYILLKTAALPGSKLPGIGWRVDPSDLADFVAAGSNSCSPALATAS